MRQTILNQNIPQNEPRGLTSSLVRFMQVTVVSSFLMIATIQSVLATEAQATINTEQQAMPVEVTIITEQSIRLWKEFSGRLFPVDYVEIRPQVSGLITEVKFEDGQLVNKGDVLYIIDPRILKAIVAQKKADLITAKNRYSFADKEHKRVIDLVKKKMVPQQVIDEYLNTKLIADSSVNHAKAELAEAEINLSYAYIKAPISGRVSRTELTEGNLVSAGIQAPILTSIVANKSIYADFEVDEHTYLRYTNGLSTVDAGKQKNPVELRLQAGDHVYKGEIHAFDNMIDPASGTIRARARFDNSQGKLLAGMYARLKLGSITEEKVILISELAIGTDQDRKFVYIVNDDNKTVYRQIQVSDSIKGDRIVSSGLEAGDKVILGGLMRIRPDMPVEPTITTNSGDF